MTKKTDAQSPQQIAKAEKQRLAAEEGARAMEELDREAIAIRKNMARLRELRLAKKAEAVRTEIATGNQPRKNQTKKAIQIRGRLHWRPLPFARACVLVL